MKSLGITVIKTLHYYYEYVEYIRTVVNNETPKRLSRTHYFAIALNIGCRPKAMAMIGKIAKKHFPELFILTGWKKVLSILLGEDPEDYEPIITSLAESIKSQPKVKQKAFFKDLYAMIK